MSKKQEQTNKQIEIRIGEKTYPYKETMGAMLAFKQETGLDAPIDTEDTIKYMYHVVKAMCRRNKEEFGLSFEEFADGLDGDEYLRVITALQTDGGKEDNEKNA